MRTTVPGLSMRKAQLQCAAHQRSAKAACFLEKLVYTFWSDRPAEALAAELGGALGALECVAGLQLNLPDTAFSGGQGPLHNLLPRFDGTVSVWLQSRRERNPVEALLKRHCDGFHGYAVCESRPMAPRLPAPDASGRIDALSQVCLLRKPASLSLEDFLSIWLDSHSDIAMDRQGTVGYVQNIVQAPVTADAPEIHGIVEECYPAAAYADLGLFFGAPDDPAAMQENIQALVESSGRFIDMGALERIFTAPYVFPVGNGALAQALDTAGSAHG